MQNISVRLSNSHFCMDLPNLVEELYYAPLEHINLTFWGKIELTLPGHQGSITLDDIISKVESTYKNFNHGCQRDSLFRPAKNIQKILRMHASLEERVSQKIQTASKVTKVFLWIRECIVWLWFSRAYSADRLNYISLSLIPMMAHFHLSSVSKILAGHHLRDTVGEFSGELPVELADDAVILTTGRVNTSEYHNRRASIALTNRIGPGDDITGIDLIATKPENFLQLQEYLINNKLAHCYTLMSLDELKEKADRNFKASVYSTTTTPFPYWWQKRDYFLE